MMDFLFAGFNNGNVLQGVPAIMVFYTKFSVFSQSHLLSQLKLYNRGTSEFEIIIIFRITLYGNP